MVGGTKGQSLFTAKVLSTDGETCCVDIDGLVLSDVQLRAVVNGEESGILITPKTGSYVTVADLSGDWTRMVVVGFSEVESIKFYPLRFLQHKNSNPKAIIVFCASINPLRSYTVALPYSLILPIRLSVASASPFSSVRMLACCCSKSNEEPTIDWNAWETLPMALVITSKLNAAVLNLSKKLFVFLAFTSTFPKAASIWAMPV